jgi:hypothetical protein
MKPVTVTNKLILNFFINSALQSLASTLVVPNVSWRDRLTLAGIAGLTGVVNYMKTSPTNKVVDVGAVEVEVVGNSDEKRSGT